MGRGKGLGASQQGCGQGHIWVTAGEVEPGPAVFGCALWRFILFYFVLYYFKLRKSQFRLSQWLSNEEYICQSRRRGFYSWVWKIPWRRKWQPIPAFLPREFHGQENLACCSPWVPVRHNLATEQQQMCVCQSQSPTLIIPPPCFLTWYHKFVFCGSVDGRKLLGGSTWHEDKDMVPEK